MASTLEKSLKARQGSETSLASANIKTNTATGGSTLARLRAAQAAQSKPTLTTAANIYASDEEKKRQEEEKNKGGLFGGIGYVAEKLGLGVAQGIEGIFDFAIGGIADIVGADDFAERQFANDWFNYSHADEWYNPGEGWKVAGDVAGGVGSSIPTLATAAAVTYFTGGAGAGIAASLVAGTSAAGTSVKEAYQETGELTGKEWGYGTLSGVTEAAIEKISGGLGAGATAIGKRLGQAFGKTAAKEVGKTTLKTVAVDLGGNFLSEAFEEGFSEWVSPYYKRMTYDPAAENATPGEIAYAAIVGGLSGLVTSGAGTTVTTVKDIRSGSKIENSGRFNNIKAVSEVILEAEHGKTNSRSVNAVRELYRDLTEGSLKITDGEKLNVKQKRALGELETANMSALFEDKMQSAAINAVKNADAVAERLNSYGNIKLADGKLTTITDIEAFKRDNPNVEVRDITAEDIRAGFDTKNGKDALYKAMKGNDVLRYVAASDVAGRLIMSVEQFEKTALEGTTIKNQVDLNKFIEDASAEKRAALGTELGIAEVEWDTLRLGRLNEAVRSYRESGRAEARRSRVEAVNKAKSVDESQAKKKIPSVIALGDGKTARYKTNKVDIAVYRNGDSFVVYDYNENAPSRALSREEVNSVLRQIRDADSAADVAKVLKSAENAELTSTEQGNVSVSGENSLSPSARMTKDVAVVERAEAIDLTNDSELAAKVNNLHGAEKYKIIQQYILGILGGQEVRLSDGKNAIVDKSDALHIANMSGNKKTAQIAKIKELVEKARLCAEDKNPVHNKFNYFCYYEATVRYAGKEFPVYLNVGKAINDGSYHIYDITEKIRDTANRINGLERPKPNEGYALKNDVSIDSIPDSAEKSNSFEENSQENAENSADFGKNAISAESSSEKAGTRGKSSSKKTSKERVAEVKERIEAKKIDEYLRENVEDYDGLKEADRSMVRKVVREGRVHGLSEADILSYARVAAHTGINIEYDANMKDGDAGYYDPKANKIVVNPKSEKKQELILIHELDHAVRKLVDLGGNVHTLAYEGAEKGLSKKTWEQIKADYADQNVDVSREELLADEASAYYTEAILGGKVTVDMLLEDNSTLKKKILNFFSSAARAYSKDEKLSRAARRHYKSFKAMFDAFAKANQGRNAETAVATVDNGKLTVESEKSARQSKNVEAKLAEYKKPITHNDILTLRSIGRKSVNEFTSADIEASGKWAYKFYKELGTKSPFFRAWFGDWRSKQKNKGAPYIKTINGVNVSSSTQGSQFVSEGLKNGTLFRGDVVNDDTKFKINIGAQVYNDTLTYASRSFSRDKDADAYSARLSLLNGIKTIAETSVLFDTETLKKDETNPDRTFVHKFYSVAKINSKHYLVKLTVDELNAKSGTIRRAYNVNNIEISPIAVSQVYKPAGAIGDSGEFFSTYSISDLFDFVKTYDKEFKPKSVNPALLNEDGTPKVFYHGTNAEFWEFKAEEMSHREGSYFFAENKEDAEAYGDNVYEVYLHGENLADYDNQPSEFYKFKSKREQVEWLKERGYDGWYADMDSGGWGELSVFSSEQIKSATDNIGTFDGESKDIRYAKEIKPELAEGGKVESVMGRDARVGAKRASAFSHRRTEMTKGQLQQMIARYTGEKVYTSKEARETIDDIAGIFTLSQKNRAKLSEALWQGYNACKTDEERQQFSYDMAEYVTMMLLTESSVDNPDRAGSLETLSKLKSGIGHLTFNDSQRGDLRRAFDKAGYKKFISRWGFRETMQPNRRRESLDSFVHNLAENNPEYAYLVEMAPQDAIVELDRIYERTIEDSKGTIGYLDDMPDSEFRYMIDDIGTAIYESFGAKGEKSTVEKIIEARLASAERKYAKLKNKYDELERKYIEEQGRPRKLLNLSYQIQKMKNLQLGTFLNATDYKNEVFKKTFEILGSIEFRGNISPVKVRTAMKRLAEWYTEKNPVLAEIPGEPGSQKYSDWIALQINAIAEGKGDGDGGFTNFELDQLDTILRHATRIVEEFDRVWFKDKWKKADTMAKDFIGVAEEASLIRVKSGSYRKVRKMLDNLSRKYFLSFGDPMSVFRYMDGYMPGFYTEMGEELRQGAFRYQVDMMEMKTEYDKFLEGNKKYLKNASTEVVEYAGVKMTKLQFISLYMTMQRGQAVRGLAENGFSLIDVSGRRVEADGFLERVQKRLGDEAGIEKDSDGNWKVSAEQLDAATKAEIAEMKKKLSKTDLEFIGVIESTLNGRCKDLKKMRDMERLGFSNTIEGYYYPIVRAMIAKNIDTKGMWGEIDRASNISANKDTVKGAKGALWIESADTVFNRHIDAVARYAELSPVIDSINKIFNLDVSGNKNRPRSVRTATFNAWQTDKIFGGAVADGQKHGGEAYLKELLADVQGIGKDVGIGDTVVNGIRGRFAIAALSANPKVLATQFSSVFASTSIISMKDITAGSKLAFAKNADADVDKYCSVAKLRNYDSSAAKAQGVIDNISSVGENLMAGVGFMDRQVVKTVWGGAQANIERTMGLKIGTEENKIEAGKLLERIIFETQQNSVATEKSSAMRSKSAFMKTLTMFTSDATKNIGRVIDGLGRVAALKQRIKTAKAAADGDTVSKLQAELEEATPQARAAIGALAINAVYMTLIARLFSHLYAKEDEEEGWKPLVFISDTFGNMLGGLPVFSDLYDFFTNGYEISDSVYDTINDVLVGTKKVANVAAGVMDGTATSADVNSAAMSFTQNLCTVLGLPMRNARNLVMGLIRRFSPNTAYKMEMLTKNKNLASDFEAAVEAGDDSKASMILGLLLEDRLGEDAEQTVGDADPYKSEILRMSKAGYNVLPRTIGDSVTIAGEEVIMYPEEQAALRARYSEAVGVIESLVGSSAYASLSDEQRESAVRFVYDVYYDQGIYELYGYERNMKRRVFSKVISAEKLALANAVTAGLESDYEDEKGKAVSEDKWAAIRGTTAKVNYSAVSGSKRKKVIVEINKLPLTTAEKLLIIAYKGYTIKDGDIRGVSADRAKKMLSQYAKKTGLTADEAKALESYL